MNERKCLGCGKDLEIKEGKKRINPKRKYCNNNCRSRDVSRKRHLELKGNPKYKEEKRRHFNNWLEKNREHFNDLVREPNRLYQEKKRKERKEKGLCMNCGAERDNKKFVNCDKCREKLRENYRKKKQ